MSTLAESLERKLVAAEREATRIAHENSRLHDELFDANQTIQSITAERDALAAELAEIRKGAAA